jgi:hypothetical protein
MKRILHPIMVWGCGFLLLAGQPQAAAADDIAEKGRTLFKKFQRTVVTVQITIKSKISMAGRGGQSNESRQDVTGTVIDPSGLAVLSLSATDPAQLVQNMMPEDDSRFKMETELSDIKMLLEDGTEVPADVVLRDKDLDLAFIRPKTKLATPLEALDLTKSAKVEVLDPIIGINRLGNAAGRAYSASVERISAIVQRPRLFYVPDVNMTTSTLGCPGITLEGNVVGIFVMRSIKGRSGGSSMFSTQGGNYTGIIVPADDVLKAAKQVPPGADEKK